MSWFDDEDENEDEEERKYPGDPGYKGGTFTTDVHTEKGSVRIKTVKDANGNIISVTEEPLWLGIF